MGYGPPPTKIEPNVEIPTIKPHHPQQLNRLPQIFFFFFYVGMVF